MPNIIVKWSGKEYEIDAKEDMTVLNFKEAIEVQTSIKPKRQKLLNLKHNGKLAKDNLRMGQCNLKPGMKIMIIGSLESAVQDARAIPKELPDVINDLDIPDDKFIPVKEREDYLIKIEKRIKNYDIKILNDMRPGKKLLVLDIDYTLFDHRSTAETGMELMRPYLHEFLSLVYQTYDIVIWSATGMSWIEEKMKLLGVSAHPLYKISFYLDSLAMITVQAPDYGVVNVKPLGVIWGKFAHYSAKNTVIVDDLRRNFLMNPQNGLKIKAFRKAHLNRKTDFELLRIGRYLDKIGRLEDLSSLHHSKWEKYLGEKE